MNTKRCYRVSNNQRAGPVTPHGKYSPLRSEDDERKRCVPTLLGPLTYDGGEAAGGFVPSHKLVEFRVVKLQALQEGHISSLPFRLEDVEQTAWQGRNGVAVKFVHKD